MMRQRDSALAEIDDVEVVGATDKAIRVRVDGGREVWVPQSQVHDNSEVWKLGDKGTLVVPEWLAIDKGLV